MPIVRNFRKYLFVLLSLACFWGCSDKIETMTPEEVDSYFTRSRVLSKKEIYKLYDNAFVYSTKYDLLKRIGQSYTCFGQIGIYSFYLNTDDVIAGNAGYPGLMDYINNGRDPSFKGKILNCICINLDNTRYYFQRIGLDKYILLFHSDAYVCE